MNKRWDAKQICDILIVWMSLILLKFLIKQSSIQSLSCVQLFVNSWTAIHQVSLSITNSWSLLKLMSIKSVMPSNHLIFCRPLLLPPSLFPSIRVFSNESVLCIRLAEVLELQIQHQSFQWIFPLGLPGLISLQSKGLSRVFSNITV